MREVLPEIERWRMAGDPIAIATVIETWGSAPRQVGAKMAMTPSGSIAGSVSGGCVESAVFEAATRVLESGTPRRLRFGVADDKAWEVGLACGGEISVFVEPLDGELFEPLRAAFESRATGAVATVVEGPAGLLAKKLVLASDGASASNLPEPLAHAAEAAARTAIGDTTSRLVMLSPEGLPCEMFIEAVSPPPTLVMIGGVHIAVALTALARALGYLTVVIDPRETFASAARFPHADVLLSAWPDQGLDQLGLDTSTAVAVLTHDPKFDDPALRHALPSDAFYVGALGSQKTQEKRKRRLLESGLAERDLARLHAPIGLDLKGRSPEEIALAVMAEIVAVRNRAR
jgi:xanthine dehydrogenase accessory factor